MWDYARQLGSKNRRGKCCNRQRLHCPDSSPRELEHNRHFQSQKSTFLGRMSHNRLDLWILGIDQGGSWCKSRRFLWSNDLRRTLCIRWKRSCPGKSRPGSFCIR